MITEEIYHVYFQSGNWKSYKNLKWGSLNEWYV